MSLSPMGYLKSGVGHFVHKPFRPQQKRPIPFRPQAAILDQGTLIPRFVLYSTKMIITYQYK